MTDGRCAVIGAELVCACGFGKESCIRELYAGNHAFQPINRFDTEHLPTNLAAAVPELQCGNGASLCLPMLEFLAPQVADLPESTPVLMASTIGEIDRLYHSEGTCTLHLLLEDALKLFRKNSGRIISAACASTNAAIDRARRMILSGKHEKVIVAACDLVSEFAFSGFASLGAMTAEIPRPYDRNRSGLLLGEAAGILILASEKAAVHHEASAWIAGSGMSGDALHITAPRPEGTELENAIRTALGTVPPEKIGAVIGHGTGTKYNDEMEINAIRRVFVNPIPLASAKGSCGHTLGASGMIQAILAVEALRRKSLFPQTGLETPEPGAEQMVSRKEQHINGNFALSLNSGFGGLNAAILLEAQS